MKNKLLIISFLLSIGSIIMFFIFNNSSNVELVLLFLVILPLLANVVSFVLSIKAWKNFAGGKWAIAAMIISMILLFYFGSLGLFLWALSGMMGGFRFL